MVYGVRRSNTDTDSGVSLRALITGGYEYSVYNNTIRVQRINPN